MQKLSVLNIIGHISLVDTETLHSQTSLRELWTEFWLGCLTCTVTEYMSIRIYLSSLFIYFDRWDSQPASLRKNRCSRRKISPAAFIGVTAFKWEKAFFDLHAVCRRVSWHISRCCNYRVLITMVNAHCALCKCPVWESSLYLEPAWRSCSLSDFFPPPWCFQKYSWHETAQLSAEWLNNSSLTFAALLWSFVFGPWHL